MLLAISSVSLTQAKTASPLQVNITSVGYTDLDDDGLADDIFVTFTVDGLKESGATKIEIYLDITLPSGTLHKSLFYVVSNVEKLHLYIHAFNTATESGWYRLDLATVKYGDTVPVVAESSVIFDPPTGAGNGDPLYKIGTA